MRRKLVLLGLILLVLAGFPLILRVFGSRRLLGGFDYFPNGVPSSDPQISTVMILLRMGLLSLLSLGLMMGIMMTAIGAVSPPSKKKMEPIEKNC